MESADAWLTGRDARERTGVPSRRMIGPSVHLVRLLGAKVPRSAAGAGVRVGCLSAIEGCKRSARTLRCVHDYLSCFHRCAEVLSFHCCPIPDPSAHAPSPLPQHFAGRVPPFTVSLAMFQQTATPSRRANYRIAALVDVWVCWNCNGREDISRVRDMSIGGLFLNTRLRRATGTPMKIDFLVQEGQIRAEAVVRHAVLDRGLGLKFTALTEQDRPRFAALMHRVRN